MPRGTSLSGSRSRCPSRLALPLSLCDIAATHRRFHYWDDRPLFHYHIVHRDEQRRTLDWVELALRRRKVLSYTSLYQRVVLRPAICYPSEAISQDTNRCMNLSGSGGTPTPTVDHLHIRVELREKYRIRDVGGEYTDAVIDLSSSQYQPSGRLLDNRLSFLARRVIEVWNHELQFLAILGADAIGSALQPACSINWFRLVDIGTPISCSSKQTRCGALRKFSGHDPGTT